MYEERDVKDLVKEKYGEIARQNRRNEKRCKCGCAPETDGSAVVKDDYKDVEGYVSEADLDLGCGLPTKYAGIDPGDTVVDLGSGAGNDVFVARAIVGERGTVIGVDMTSEMIDRAEENRKKLGYDNVEFRLGDIEALPVDDGTADVVISNCVLNLVPDKKKAFAEIYRVLKPGAHFCVSDITLKGKLPAELKKSAELYVGCVAGAVDINDYLAAVENAGFSNVKVKSSKQVQIPADVLKKYLTPEKSRAFHEQGAGIFSVTVTGTKEKPGV